MNHRITQCAQGHPYTIVNSYIKKNGTRDCRACRNIANRKRCAQTRANKLVAVRKLPKPKAKDLQWAAGFFEGEGCITMARIKSQKCDKLTTAKIVLGNTDRPLVEFFKFLWGGTFRVRKKKLGYKQVYEWVLMGKQVWIFLTDLKPYFKSKRVLGKANLIMASEEFRCRSPKFGEESIATQAKLWEFLEQIRILNTRGDHRIPS